MRTLLSIGNWALGMVLVSVLVIPSTPGFCQRPAEAGKGKKVLDNQTLVLVASDSTPNEPGGMLRYNYATLDDRKRQAISVGTVTVQDCNAPHVLDSLLVMLNRRQEEELRKDSVSRQNVRVSLRFAPDLTLECLAGMLRKIIAHTQRFDIDPRTYEILIYGKNFVGR